jgi:hypothetical protein
MGCLPEAAPATNPVVVTTMVLGARGCDNHGVGLAGTSWTASGRAGGRRVLVGGPLVDQLPLVGGQGDFVYLHNAP